MTTKAHKKKRNYPEKHINIKIIIGWLTTKVQQDK